MVARNFQVYYYQVHPVEDAGDTCYALEVKRLDHFEIGMLLSYWKGQ